MYLTYAKQRKILTFEGFHLEIKASKSPAYERGYPSCSARAFSVMKRIIGKSVVAVKHAAAL